MADIKTAAYLHLLHGLLLTVAKIKCCLKNEQICPSPSVRLIKGDDGLQYSHNFLEATVVWKCGMEIVARQFFRLLSRNVSTFYSWVLAWYSWKLPLLYYDKAGYRPSKLPFFALWMINQTVNLDPLTNLDKTPNLTKLYLIFFPFSRSQDSQTFIHSQSK